MPVSRQTARWMPAERALQGQERLRRGRSLSPVDGPDGSAMLEGPGGGRHEYRRTASCFTGGARPLH